MEGKKADRLQRGPLNWSELQPPTLAKHMTCGRVSLSGASLVAGLKETALGDVCRKCLTARATVLLQHDGSAVLAQSDSGRLHQEVSEVAHTPAQGADLRRGPQ